MIASATFCRSTTTLLRSSNSARTIEGEVESATTGQAVTIRIADALNISSGYRFGDNPDSGIQRNSQVELENFGTEGGSRTHTGVTPMDFESIASAIPPLRLWVTRLSSV